MIRRVHAPAPAASITVDEDGTIVELNPAAEKIFGLTRHAALGESIETIVPSELRNAAVTEVRRLTTGGPELALDQLRELEAMRADGSRVRVELLVTRTSTDPPRFTGWIRDLGTPAPPSAESRREDLLAARAEQAVRLGSWELDIASGEQLWSDNLYRLMGLEAGECELSAVNYGFDLIHEDDIDRVERLWEGLSTAGELAPLEFRVVWASGEVRHLRTTLSITERDGERPIKAIGSVQDITELRRSQREVAAHVAVIESLKGWTSLEERGPELLRRLVRAFDAAVGAIWIPQGDVLVCIAVWPSRTLRSMAFVDATHAAKLPRRSGLPGVAWERCEPVSLSGPEDFDFGRGQLAVAAGLETGLAFPAIADGEALFVVEVLAREQFELTESLSLSLSAIGHQLGQFMSRRRGELAPSLVTPRELELLKLAANGMSGPKIAEELTISRATVKTHFENIYAKLGVSDRASAVAEALRLGLIG